MVLTLDTFNVKLLDLIDFIGWNIIGYTTSRCKDIHIETSKFVNIERMKLYLVVFDFHHNKWGIFNLFFIAMVFF